MTPSTEPAQRIAIMFKRRPTTPWNDREIRAYKRLVKDGCFTTLDDLELLERYYVFERRKQDKGIHRRDLATFLNNYAGELDRAHAWDDRFRRAARETTKRMYNDLKPVNDEEFKRLGDLAREELRRCREQLRQPNYEAQRVIIQREKGKLNL